MLKNVKIFLDKIIFLFYNKTVALSISGKVREDFMIEGTLMTIDDLAGYLKVTRRTIYDWLKHNKIPAVKLVGQWRFKKDKIDSWIENRSLH
jgi:excisionase family DNA binding protein